MEFRELEAMVETHECAQCGGTLVIIHSDGAEPWLLVCGQDHAHKGLKLHESKTTAIARGKGDQVIGPGAQKSLEQSMARARHELSLMPKRDIATGADIRNDQLVGLVKWGELLGLKPYLGHICLYYGEPYVTIDGYYYLLNTRVTDMYVGTRPLNSVERIDYQVPNNAHAWVAEAWLGVTKLPTTGLGIVTQEEIGEKSTKKPTEFRAPIARSHPQRMAEKRAEWQLLRKLVPLEEVKPAPEVHNV